VSGRLQSVLRDIARALQREGVGWALVGGLAVSVRSEPRFTRDVDVAVAAADDGEAEALLRSLRAGGHRVQTLVEQEAIGRLATARLVPRGEESAGVVVDLLFASSGIEPEIVAAAEALEAFAGVAVPVARTGHLIATKLLAEEEARPFDRADMLALLACADDAEIDLARRAVRLIERRGFNRGRSLEVALDTLLTLRSSAAGE
jgi:predicted nucleotidyltransferase